jgi:hypothetical protein
MVLLKLIGQLMALAHTQKAPPHYSPRPSPIHGCNPKLCARPGSGHRAVLTNPVRCCRRAFAHTPTSPTSLDSRCSALRCEPRAPDNGQTIDTGRHAAVFHRSHHSNGHPVGGTKIRHAEEPISAAGTARRAPQIILSMAVARVLAS